MDWDDLRIFLAVAREESLSRAGRRLGRHLQRGADVGVGILRRAGHHQRGAQDRGGDGERRKNLDSEIA